jgi:hypothetical protein
MRFIFSVVHNRSNSGTKEEMEAIDIFNNKLIEKGHWVLAAGVQDPSDAYVVDNRLHVNRISRGPLNNTEEFMSGFWVIEAKDENEAQVLAVEASLACNRKIEVRKFL